MNKLTDEQRRYLDRIFKDMQDKLGLSDSMIKTLRNLTTDWLETHSPDVASKLMLEMEEKWR